MSALSYAGLDELGAVDGRLRELTDGLREPLKAAVTGLVDRQGKRLRSRLLLTCSRLGEAVPGRIASLCAVVELLHVASLLHDDIVDDASTRRCCPAAHAVVGPEQAMLAGLACFALAGMAATDLGPAPATLVSRAAAGLAYGELLDVERAFDIDLPVSDYLELVERKTGDLFGLCCLLGALKAGATGEQAEAVRRFGTEFGIVFQIMDDCLDFAAGASGKPTGTDHRLGLFGAPTLLALANDSGELASLLLRPSFDVGDLPAVRRLVVAAGGVAAATELAADHREQALSALDVLGDHPVRAQLLAMTAPPDAPGHSWPGDVGASGGRAGHRC